MSKIYEAMMRSEGQATQDILSELVQGSAVVPERAAASSDLSEAVQAALQDTTPKLISELETKPNSNGWVFDGEQGSARGLLETVRVVPIQVQERSPVLPFDNTHPAAAELYRIIRTKIVQDSRSPRMVVITSPGPGDGKTVTALNVAGALSLKSASVLLIDGDLRKPAIHNNLGISGEPGLAGILERSTAVENAMIRCEQLPNLYILTAGLSTVNPAELLDSPGWKDLCSWARQKFEHIIIDSPPIASVADYDLIQAVCDVVMLIVRPDHTSRKLCLQALRTVPKEKLLGTVLNRAEGWLLNSRNSGYYYGNNGTKAHRR